MARALLEASGARSKGKGGPSMRKVAALGVAALVALLAGGCASNHQDGFANAGAGKTLTGKVVSFTDATVTVETATGREVIGLTGETEGRDQLVVGAEVAIAFQRSSGRGEPVATRIQPASTAKPKPNR